MCFTSGPTEDDKRGPSLIQGLRTKLLQTSGPQRNKSKRLPSRRSSSYSRVKRQAVAKVMGVTIQDSQSKTALISRQGSRAEKNTMQITEAKANSVSGRSRQSNGYTSDSENLLGVSRRGVQSERFTRDPQNGLEQDKTTFIRAVSMVTMNTKQMKVIITGMGKELRRAANTVSERLPNPTKKKNNEERERQDLLDAEAPRPHARTPEEIKKAYGRSADERQAASITHAKLLERGEKLSAIHRRTGELEADAANFSSLAQELVRKMENRKWYEI